MLGLGIIAIAMILRETATSIGKDAVAHRHETVYAMGFLNAVWSVVILLIAALFFEPFIFSLDALPTYALRIVLELILVFVTIHAIVRADRSTFGFLRIWTIPLLLLVDLSLGYDIALFQILGISVIVASFLLLFINHGLSKKGALLTLTSALLAVLTISLYKYHITHFNSVTGEQLPITLIVVIVLFISAYIAQRKNPLRLLGHPRYFLQSAASGLSSVLVSFAFLFGPASVITVGKRAFAILMSVFSGHYYFKEKRFTIKLLCFALIVLGLILLIV